MVEGTFSVCACGHPYGSHLDRWGTASFVQSLMLDGKSACNDCECTGYLRAATVPNEFRTKFRVRAKMPHGNVGSSHPLMVALSRVDVSAVEFEPMVCFDCGSALDETTAILLDSAFYCGICFLGHPEVYVASSKNTETSVP